MRKFLLFSFIIATAMFLFGCSGSSGDGAPTVYAVKHPNDVDPFLIRMEIGKSVTNGHTLDIATLLDPPTSTFALLVPSPSAYDSLNNAILTMATTDIGDIVVSISTASGRVSRFSTVDYSGNVIVAFYTKGSNVYILLQNLADDTLKLSTVSLETRLEIVPQKDITVNPDALSTLGNLRGDNFFVDAVAGKLFFLGDNQSTVNLFVIDLSSGLLSAVGGPLPYDSTYSCLFNDGDFCSVISDNGNNDVDVVSISKSNGEIASRPLDTLSIREPTDTARFINDYLHAAYGNYVFGAISNYGSEIVGSIDHLFSLNRATGEIVSHDNTAGCYYAVVIAK